MSWRAQGLRTWLVQRLSAIYMLVYLVVILVLVCQIEKLDFTSWKALFSNVSVNIATLLFFLALLYHAWVGVRDILIDYASNSIVRFVLWGLITLALVAMSLWVFIILLPLVWV